MFAHHCKPSHARMTKTHQSRSSSTAAPPRTDSFGPSSTNCCSSTNYCCSPSTVAPSTAAGAHGPGDVVWPRRCPPESHRSCWPTHWRWSFADDGVVGGAVADGWRCPSCWWWSAGCRNWSAAADGAGGVGVVDGWRTWTRWRRTRKTRCCVAWAMVARFWPDSVAGNSVADGTVAAAGNGCQRTRRRPGADARWWSRTLGMVHVWSACMFGWRHNLIIIIDFCFVLILPKNLENEQHKLCFFSQNSPEYLVDWIGCFAVPTNRSMSSWWPPMMWRPSSRTEPEPCC